MTSRDVGLRHDRAESVTPGVGVGLAGHFVDANRSSSVLSPVPHRRPVVQRGHQHQGHPRRTASDGSPRVGRRDPVEVDPSGAERIGVMIVGLFLGVIEDIAPDRDHLVEQRPIGNRVGRFPVHGFDQRGGSRPRGRVAGLGQ